MPIEDKTLELLQRWNEGDRQALDLLVEKNLSFLAARVRRRLGSFLRRKEETMDIVQDAMVEFLRYGPRSLLSNQAQFRALLGKVVENVLRDKYDWFTAKRRDLHKERPLPGDTLLGLDPGVRSPTTPSEAAQRNEEEARIRLALELLPPPDRKVLVLRIFEEKGFREIGESLGIGEDGARMRFRRALPKLSRKVESLKKGDLGGALA